MKKEKLALSSLAASAILLISLLASFPAFSGHAIRQTTGDLDADMREAFSAGKAVVFVVSMDECPSCVLLEEWLESDEKRLASIHAKAMLISINIRGSIPLTIGGRDMTEAQFARTLGAYATPTASVVHEAGRFGLPVVGLNGVKTMLLETAGKADERH